MKYLVLTSALVLAACGDAADMPVAAPGEDIIAQDVEGVSAPVTLDSYVSADDLKRELFTSAPMDNLELGMDVDVAEPIIRESFDRTGEGIRATNVSKLYATDGRTIILATQEGMSDDSIDSLQLYAEFVPISPLQTSLEFMGVRQKCARGSNTTEWTTETCP